MKQKKAPATQLWRFRALDEIRVLTPGHGIDRDRADCSVGEGAGQGLDRQLSADAVEKAARRRSCLSAAIREA